MKTKEKITPVNNLSSYDIVEIRKNIQHNLKLALPNFKFHFRTSRFSGGQSLNIYILSGDIKAFRQESGRAFGDINDQLLSKRDYPEYKQVAENLESKEIYTEEMYKALQLINSTVKEWQNYESDPYSDYINTNFFFNLCLGRYAEPYKFISPEPAPVSPPALKRVYSPMIIKINDNHTNIMTVAGEYLKSYNSIVAFKTHDRDVIQIFRDWDCSATTLK